MGPRILSSRNFELKKFICLKIGRDNKFWVAKVDTKILQPFILRLPLLTGFTFLEVNHCNIFACGRDGFFGDLVKDSWKSTKCVDVGLSKAILQLSNMVNSFRFHYFQRFENSFLFRIYKKKL